MSKPITKTMLTVAAIEKYKPGKVRREIRDAGAIGHYLVIETSGAKSFAMRFRRPSGKSARLVLGPVEFSTKEPEDKPILETRGTLLTLAASRALVAEVHRQRALGRDVIDDLKAAKGRRRGAAGASVDDFAAALRDYVDKHGRENVKAWRKLARHLGLAYPVDGGPPTLVPGGLAERWSGRPVRSLGSRTSVPSSMRPAIAACRGLPAVPRARPARWRGCSAGTSPPRSVGCTAKAASPSRCPSPSCCRRRAPRAIGRSATTRSCDFWNAAEALGAPLTQMLRLLLILGVRRSELAGMCGSSELSADGTEWLIPGTRTKNKREHKVPLPPLARRIFASVPVIEGTAGLVFTNDGKRAIANWSGIKSRLDIEMALPSTARPFAIHDVRRTVATGMAELGVPPHIVEAVLNHVSGAQAGRRGRLQQGAARAGEEGRARALGGPPRGSRRRPQQRRGVARMKKEGKRGTTPNSVERDMLKTHGAWGDVGMGRASHSMPRRIAMRSP